jgi:Subtilisin inhibitor-like
MRPTSALLALLALLLAACASPSGGDGADGSGDPAGGGISQADDDLLVQVDLGDGTPAADWTLSCVGGASGSHPQAEAACAHLAGLEEPFAPLPDDVVCTEQFGGPQTARVTGRWDGEPVDLELSRADGCRIAQWDSLGPLLPVPVGVEPVG